MIAEQQLGRLYRSCVDRTPQLIRHHMGTQFSSDGMMMEPAKESHETDPIEQIRTQLRNVGLRATPARIATLQQLQRADSPVTHAEIADNLVPLGYDKATVFRNLSDLTDAKLISRTELGDRVWRFELRSEHSHDEHHPHFVCVECGSVSCLKEMKFTNASQKSADVIGEITEILIKGFCKDCQHDQQQALLPVI